MASVHCECGNVQIKFTSDTPRVTVECCCDQCYKKINCLVDLGGREITKTEPIVAKYFDNKLVVTKGRDRLDFYKLIQETNVINMYASCCKTFLMSLHPLYHDVAVAVLASEHYPPTGTRFSNLTAQRPSLRYFADHWTEEERANLANVLPEVRRDKNNRTTGSEGWEAALKHQLKQWALPIPEDADGESFQEILEDRGNDVMVFGWQSSRAAKRTVILHEKVSHPEQL